MDDLVRQGLLVDEGDWYMCTCGTRLMKQVSRLKSFIIFLFTVGINDFKMRFYYLPLL